jgi:hypothetical protein
LNPGQGNLIDISVDSNNFTFIAQYPGKISWQLHKARLQEIYLYNCEHIIWTLTFTICIWSVLIIYVDISSQTKLSEQTVVSSWILRIHTAKGNLVGRCQELKRSYWTVVVQCGKDRGPSVSLTG